MCICDGVCSAQMVCLIFTRQVSARASESGNITHICRALSISSVMYELGYRQSLRHKNGVNAVHAGQSE